MGSEHIGLCSALGGLALVSLHLRKFAEAEQFYQRALTIAAQKHSPAAQHSPGLSQNHQGTTKLNTTKSCI
jgi:hypothetical protein